MRENLVGMTPLQKEAIRLCKKYKFKQIAIAADNGEFADFAGQGNALGHFQIVLQLMSFMLKEEKDFINYLLNKQPSFKELIYKLYELEPLIDESLVENNSWHIFK